MDCTPFDKKCVHGINMLLWLLASKCTFYFAILVADVRTCTGCIKDWGMCCLWVSLLCEYESTHYYTREEGLVLCCMHNLVSHHWPEWMVGDSGHHIGVAAESVQW